MDLPRILPDRQRTEPVLFGVFIHDDLMKNAVGQENFHELDAHYPGRACHGGLL